MVLLNTRTLYAMGSGDAEVGWVWVWVVFCFFCEEEKGESLLFVQS